MMEPIILEHKQLSWPYNGMVHDVQVAIDGKANYLAALGLVAYSEAVGREICESQGKAFARFNTFVGEYMGYEAVATDTKGKIYDWFRNGLAHEYFIKGNKSIVAMRLSPEDKAAGKMVPGIIVSQDKQVKAFIVEEYFRDFQKGLARWLREKGYPVT